MANISKRIAQFVKSRPSLEKTIAPLASSYLELAGHRRIGLRYDDLIEEENDIVQEALRRLSPQEQYRRAYRIRIAQQCGVTHTELPREQWTKPEEDIPYLKPIVDQVKAEWAERTEMDAAIPEKNSSSKKKATGH